MVSLPYTPTLPAMLRHVANEFGDTELIVRGNRRLTYAEMERESAHMARGLLAAGAGKATRIAIIMPDSPDWVVSFFAVTRMGGFAIPMSTLYQARELRQVIVTADIDTLLIYNSYRNHDYVERLEHAFPSLAGQKKPQLYLPEAPYLRTIRVWGDCDKAWAAGDAEDLKRLADDTPAIDDAYLEAVESNVVPADLAVMIYTSGSSAEPKGVMHTHGTVVRHSKVMSEHYGRKHGDRMSTASPFFWIGGLNIALLNSMHKGVTLLCPEVSDPVGIMDFVEKERITHVGAWRTQMAAILAHPEFQKRDFSFVKSGFAPPKDKDGNVIPPERRPDSLGMTETFGPHSGEHVGVPLPEGHEGSFGRAVDTVERKIVDPETGEELPFGQEGELCIRGWQLMAGMYKKEREEVFDADGFYHTGDSCILEEDGHLYYKHRLGEMVKTRGANVAPREVELVLQSFDDVQEAAVMGLPDRTMGELLVAVVVPVNSAKLTEAELQERLKGEISSYKVPGKIFVRAYDDIPRTDSNKPHKRKMRDMLIEEIEAASSAPGSSAA